MTQRSLVIEEHPDRQSAARTYVPGENAPKFCTLNAYTWPAPAWKFAEENKLEVSYVDNCWLRLAIDGPLLRLFFGERGRFKSRSWRVLGPRGRRPLVRDKRARVLISE